MHVVHTHPHKHNTHKIKGAKWYFSSKCKGESSFVCVRLNVPVLLVSRIKFFNSLKNTKLLRKLAELCNSLPFRILHSNLSLQHCYQLITTLLLESQLFSGPLFKSLRQGDQPELHPPTNPRGSQVQSLACSPARVEAKAEE